RILSLIEDLEKLLSRKGRSEPSLLFDLEEDDMVGQARPQGPIPDLCSMEKLLQAPIDGVGDSIVVPLILANQFELKIARTWIEKEPPNSITTCNDLVSKIPKKLTIIEIKSKVQAPRNKTQVANVSGSSTQDAHVTALTKQVEALLSSFNQPVNSVLNGCEMCGGPHPYYECQAAGGYTQDVYATSGTYNQGGGGTKPEDDHGPDSYRNLAEALSLMPKYHKMLKDLLSDKEKLLGLANTSLTENCSAILLKKLLEKIRDPGGFLIPCDFHGLESRVALADLGASINLMPLYVWKKLSLPDLTPTRMTLELATRSIAYPAGRPFLENDPALVDVHGEELILRDSSKHPHNHGNESINMINFIDITCEDHFLEVLKFKKSNQPSNGSTTPLSDSLPSLTPFETSDSLLEEFTDELALLEPFPPRNKDDNFDPEANLRKIKYLLNQDPSTEETILGDDPALVDVHGEELILRDGSKRPHKHGNESINMINFIDITCEDRFPEVLKFNKSNHPSNGSTTPLSDSLSSLTPFETSDSLLEEFADELALFDPFPLGNEDENFDPEADLRKNKYLLNQDPSTESSPKFDIDIIDPVLERFTDKPTLVYTPPPGDDDDDLFDLKSDND
nr:reverse transcriptase domain-containing protein [Tanacetum cinerariifolium]